MQILKKNIFFISIICLLEIVFFRDLLVSGAMIGDSGDARLNNLIMEHWFHVFQGKENFDTLSMFYPVQNTISYTDMLLGESILYSIFRTVGINLFTANKITLILIHIIGSLSLYYLLVSILKLNKYASFIGVISFSFASGYVQRIGHTQMIAISLVPIILIFGIKAIVYYNKNKKRRIYLTTAIILYSLLAYTGWYAFYFLSVFLLIFIILSYLIFRYYYYETLKVIYNNIKTNKLEIAVYLAIFVILLIPLLGIYLPSIHSFGKRSWSEVLYYSPQVIDILNVGNNNLVFGKLLQVVNSERTYKGIWEISEGFSVILLISVFFLGKKFISKFKTTKYNPINRIYEIVIIVLICSVGLAIILPIDLGGVSLWWFVWKLLPGAGSLRAIARWYFFLLLPLSILVSVLLDRYLGTFKKLPYIKMFLYSSLVLIFNFNISNISVWNSSDMWNYLNTITPPPKQAKVIALKRDSSVKSWQFDQLDAWMIADQFGLKTVNGYSGQVPNGWNLKEVYSDKYLSNILSWKINHNISDDIYIYDESDKTWDIAQNPVLKIGVNYTFNNSKWASFSGEWYDPEEWGRWSNKRVEINFNLQNTTISLNKVIFKAHSFYKNHNVIIGLNGHDIVELVVTPSSQLFQITIPSEYVSSTNKLTFTLKDDTFSPSEVLKDNKDARKLGIGFESMKFENEM